MSLDNKMSLMWSLQRGVVNVVLLVICCSLGNGVLAQENSKSAISMDELLQQVKTGKLRDAKENQQRIAEFRKAKAEQQKMLEQLRQEELKQQDLSEQQEKQFEENDQQITLLRERLNDRLGALKELFGVLQQVSSDAHAQFYNSLTQLQFPDRTGYLLDFANKMGQTSDLPSIEEIERLWFELQREMVESGKIVRFSHNVITQSGVEEKQELVRVGTFNIVSDGKYLQFVPETGRVLEYARQPSSRYLNGAEELSEASRETVPFTIDPTRGQLLSMLVAAPTLKERISQGGIIGYVILVLGAVALLIAVVRMAILVVTNSRIRGQMNTPEDIGNNPLGRILNEYASHKERDLETLELKMGEAVMREVPKINRGLSFLKIIAAVAPLMGLLGTVTGMIITFQSIVLYGAGDPKMMAGGISQALVTTVLGLVVAIPTLLLHNLVQTRARSITEVLEQEAVAIVAQRAERRNARENGESAHG